MPTTFCLKTIFSNQTRDFLFFYIQKMFILCVGGDALNACVSVFTFTLNFSYTNEMALYNFTLALT